MPVVHFLNVNQGDCSVIEHTSEHITVIDVCNARKTNLLLEKLMASQAAEERAVLGNFNQKKYSVNPISYLNEHGITSVFRFIATHPDMDHLDGLKLFFDTFEPTNFWDTDNQEEKNFQIEKRYDENDWLFYKKLRDANPQSDPKRLTLYSGASGKYYNEDESGKKGGDGLQILAPTKALVDSANACEEYNDCSYVILYRTGSHRILFGGDSHDETWKHILSTHERAVADIDVLIAPHHGRASERSYDFLDVLRPKITFFGNANAEHLAYGAWNYRKLPFITNNQAGCIVADAEGDSVRIYVTNKRFAQRVNSNTFYSETYRAFYYGSV